MKIDVERAENTTRVFSSGYTVRDALRATRIKHQRNQRLGCWEVPTYQASDLIAYLEHVVGADITVIEVDR